MRKATIDLAHALLLNSYSNCNEKPEARQLQTEDMPASLSGRPCASHGIGRDGNSNILLGRFSHTSPCQYHLNITKQAHLVQGHVIS
jgi:hypothetical protein